MRILIKDINMLRMVGRQEGIIKGNIGIEGDTIMFIGNIPDGFVPEKVIEGDKALAIPALINAHTHAPMSLFRNYGDDMALMEWLETKIFPAEDKMDRDCGYWGTMLTIAELIKSGCTAFADQYFLVDSMAEAVADSGVRANISRGSAGNGINDSSVFALKETQELFDKWNDSNDGRIKIDFGPHAPYTCGNALYEQSAKLASQKGAGIHTHLCETKGEIEGSFKEFGVSPIKRMENLGVLQSDRVIAAHCVHLTDEDISLLKKYSVNVVHNPSSNLKLASGFAPISKLLSEGINVAIGTDGSSSNNNVNMCEEMHIAAILGKAVAEDPKTMNAYQVIEMATINGAKALGIEHLIGSIEVGKKADIAIIDIDRPHWYPHNDLTAAIVYSMNSEDFKTVICNGKILMENHELKTIDIKEVKDNITRLAQTILM